MGTCLLVNIGSRSSKLTWVDGRGHRLAARVLEGTARDDLDALAAPSPQDVSCTVHRLVHGGDVVTRPLRHHPGLDVALAGLDRLAPLHNPPARRWLAACVARWPTATHILVPDAGLYHDLPAVAATPPLPASWRQRFGLRRIGFHGLAHAGLQQALAARAPNAARGRVITLQLGGGCSATAWRDGRPVDTSMGYTPLAGLVMASRGGDIDPGILLHLLDAGMTPAELATGLSEASGLRGLSGLSGDMRELLRSDSAEAALAIDSFCYRARQYIGAYAASLGGLDALVFGGGIGEHQPAIRARICAGLDCLGLRLDADANAAPPFSGAISDSDSDASAWALHCDEETVMFGLARTLQETP